MKKLSGLAVRHLAAGGDPLGTHPGAIHRPMGDVYGDHGLSLGHCLGA